MNLFKFVFILLSILLATDLLAQGAYDIAPDGQPWIKSSIRMWEPDNPNLDSNWDWRDSSYTVYWAPFGNNPIKVGSPFYSEVTGGVAFTLDYEPEDGWVLVFRNFGTPENPIACPYFVLI